MSEVFDVDGASEKSDVDPAAEELSTAEEESGAATSPESGGCEEFVDPATWTWDMPLETRWEACQAFMLKHKVDLQFILETIHREMPAARKRLQEAANRGFDDPELNRLITQSYVLANDYAGGLNYLNGVVHLICI